MHFIPGEIYHVNNHGNNNATLFRKTDDYAVFFQKLNKELAELCSILGWVILPQQFQLLIQPNERACQELHHLGTKDIQTLTRKIGTLLSSYTRFVNLKYKRTGSLFRQKTKAQLLSADDTNCRLRFPGWNTEEIIRYHFHLIHNLPVIHNLADHPGEWNYSSFHDYTGKRIETLSDKEETIAVLNTSPGELTLECLAYAIVQHDKPSLTQTFA